MISELRLLWALVPDLTAWNWVGIDLGISWENGNRTGFPPGPHSVELAALQQGRT